ncbi:MAG: aromatic ring-hydroxylating dioxygenase subunit alpha [Nevskia sp.]|nr:aromatic ring-hydroxylating dioxygenase subunit alpha [Nevskia sp.]
MDDRSPLPAAPAAPDSLLRLARRLAADVEAGRPQRGPAFEIDVQRYLDPQRFAGELAVMRRGPVILAHGSQLPVSGRLALDRLGLPLLLTRDAGGVVHGHYNVCRHRGMRMVEAGPAAACRNLVCRYHGWVYGLDGRLTGVRHRDAFDELPAGLRAFPVVERHGLIWGWPEAEGREPPHALEPWLSGIGAELDYFGLGDSVAFGHYEVERKSNWKLVVEAFMEIYHIASLHRNTIDRFFLDSVAVSEPAGEHIRSAVGRRSLSGRSPDAPLDLRNDCTFTHYLFPNTILIVHPDYVSLVTLWPTAPDRVGWSHTLLIPAAQNNAAMREHWEKSFRLIEQGVFQSEDLEACEGIQAGLLSGANQALHCGRLEHAIGGFHREWDRRLGLAAEAAR